MDVLVKMRPPLVRIAVNPMTRVLIPRSCDDTETQGKMRLHEDGGRVTVLSLSLRNTLDCGKPPGAGERPGVGCPSAPVEESSLADIWTLYF